jgi:hypothetical protein
MATSLKEKLRYEVQYPLRYGLDLARARIKSGSSAVCRILIASDGLAFTSEQQFAPLLKNRRFIAEELGVVFDQRLIEDVLASSSLASSYSAAFVKLSFRTPAPEALDKIDRLQSRLLPKVRLVYFDGDDDACVQWSGLLEMVHLYVKKSIFSDHRWYQKQFIGKSNLTDYVASVHGRSFADDIIPCSARLQDSEVRKIFLGYNIALDDKITDLFRNTRPALPIEKSVDVVCRAVCAPDSWIFPLRGIVNTALAPLIQKGYSVLMPDQRVSQQVYYDELRSSRICVSPFGYGEICWRDFEAVLMGSLLVKPDMSHLRTEPDIFIPGETYVPVRWDFSDLEETCARYLEDDEARERITARAYQVLSEYHLSSRFLECFRNRLVQAGVEHLTDKRSTSLAEAEN